LGIQFAGDTYVRELDAWTKLDGRRFEFPYHDRQDSLAIKTTVRVNKDVAALLQRTPTISEALTSNTGLSRAMSVRSRSSPATAAPRSSPKDRLRSGRKQVTGNG
jgi:hypothetical protein